MLNLVGKHVILEITIGKGFFEMKNQFIGNHSKRGYLAYMNGRVEDVISSGNIKLAERMILDLLSLYPDDLLLKKHLARVYILNHQHEKAKELLETLVEDNVYIKLTSLYIKLKQENLLYSFYQKYFLDDDHLDIYFDRNFIQAFRRLQLYLKCKYDDSFCLTSDEFEQLSYLEQQIYSYDLEQAIMYILNHHSYHSYDKNNYFSKHLDLRKLFFEVQSYLPLHPDDSNIFHITMDSYVFYYPDCGKVNDVCTNYFRVVTFVGDFNIFTMYPVLDIANHPICFLPNFSDHKSLVKVRNGLERFQARYLE